MAVQTDLLNVSLVGKMNTPRNQLKAQMGTGRLGTATVHQTNLPNKQRLDVNRSLNRVYKGSNKEILNQNSAGSYVLNANLDRIPFPIELYNYSYSIRVSMEFDKERTQRCSFN